MIPQKAKTAIFCLSFCFTTPLHAQINIESIKQDSRYYCAEGEGNTVDEADENALSRISRQIAVSITNEARRRSVQEESEEGVTYSITQEGTTQSFSTSTLQNVNMVILAQEPDARVFRYVLKSEVEKMINERAAKILDFVATGKKAEQRLQIDDALRYYYWALMLAKVTPRTVYIDFNGEKGNCLSELPLKINSVLNHLGVSVEKYKDDGNRIAVLLRFKYDDKYVASLQFRYFDGQSYQGPVSVRDGMAEIDVVTLSANNKIPLAYEYRFRSEAENLDAELRAAFATAKAVSANASAEVYINTNDKLAAKSSKAELQTTGYMTETKSIKPEPVRMKTRVCMNETTDKSDYQKLMKQVEAAIRTKSPEAAYNCFTPDSYSLFRDLLTQTGTVSLSGEPSYSFIDPDGIILARFCPIKIKFGNGGTFMEKLTFRFNPQDKKIHSLAFALTQKAEDDIFSAAAQWSQVSRYTIMRFLEDYQTAYALKRLDYLKQIFSDNAIIITGSVLKPTQSVFNPEGHPIELGNNDKVQYRRLSKEEYLKRLSVHFKSREYIHLTFEDNITRIINTGGLLPDGAAFGIQIKQIYNSPSYADKGYLTLVLNMQGKQPIIEVRLWQPQKDEMIKLDEFLSKFSF